ncbi:hypothetical protein ACDP95_10590 [Weissella confusa]|uniref:Uncharacterized protein n=1 Tax=Weissella confusa TaxID=1583 RepID=A0A4Z0S8L6_WEICO|nr:hypothetical protein [Weissella confusa]TGE75955.1 hypothetical protein C6P11_00385 [Weissella confusa]
MQEMKYVMSAKASAIAAIVTIAVFAALMLLFSAEGNASTWEVELDVVLAVVALLAVGVGTVAFGFKK